MASNHGWRPDSHVKINILHNTWSPRPTLLAPLILTSRFRYFVNSLPLAESRSFIMLVYFILLVLYFYAVVPYNNGIAMQATFLLLFHDSFVIGTGITMGTWNSGCGAFSPWIIVIIFCFSTLTVLPTVCNHVRHSLTFRCSLKTTSNLKFLGYRRIIFCFT
jgi:hypothetical protein